MRKRHCVICDCYLRQVAVDKIACYRGHTYVLVGGKTPPQHIGYIAAYDLRLQ